MARSSRRTVIRALDFALCVVVSVALTYTVQGGFNVADDLHSNVLALVGVSALLEAVLFVEVARPDWKALSRVGYLVLAVVTLVGAAALSPFENPIDDVEGNLFAPAVISIVVCALVFVLSRRRGSAAVLFAAGSFTCGFIQFNYMGNMLVATAAFLLAALGLVLVSANRSCRPVYAERTARLDAKLAATAILMPLTACALAAFVVIGVIMPLNPPALSIKLQTQYLAYEEIPVKNSVVLSEDAENTVTSANTTDEIRTTTAKKEGSDEGDSLESAQSDTSGLSKDWLSGQYSDVDVTSTIAGVRTLALNTPIPLWLIILCILAALFAIVQAVRLIVRHVRLQSIVALDPYDQVDRFYRFFLSRFAKLGLARPEAHSPVEYANSYRMQLYPYVGAQKGGTFDHLTALMVRHEYGVQLIGEDDVRPIQQLYREFYRNCRRELGWPKYLFRYLTL